jgi:excisionase family DNA binding protein
MSTVVEVAHRLGISTHTIYRYVHEGLLEGRSITGSKAMDIDDESVDRLLGGDVAGGDRLVSVEQAARTLKLSRKSVRNMIRRGELVGKKFGEGNGALRVTLSSVQALDARVRATVEAVVAA